MKRKWSDELNEWVYQFESEAEVIAFKNRVNPAMTDKQALANRAHINERIMGKPTH